MTVIEALYIFDEHNTLLLDHVYTNRPAPPSTVLPLYLRHPSPRPSVIYLTSTNPPTTVFSILQDNLLFLSPIASDVEPLLVFEFLHRLVDALEEFIGSPLLATKISSNYEIVAQVVAEMADSGVVCHGEANALRDVVETGPGVLQNLLGGVGLPGSSPSLRPLGSSNRPTTLQPALSSQGSAIPWRRSNVRHTSNELYVDIVESLSVTLAPSGRPLAAFAHGSIAFTSKVSGVPDLLLSLTTGGKGGGMGTRGDQLRNVMERTVFHPCVRLNRWKSEGVMSFVPPDGRFALCGYEVDLLGPEVSLSTNKSSNINLDLPALIEMTMNVGHSGNEFEVRAVQPSNSISRTRSPAAASLQSNLTANRPGSFRTGSSGDSKSPLLEELIIHVPIPSTVRNVSELRPSKGEAHWNPAEGRVEWKILPKDFGPRGAVLKCTVQGSSADDGTHATSSGVVDGMTATTFDYTDDQPTASERLTDPKPLANGGKEDADKTGRSNGLMPTSATLSFSVKGWLASGLKVESLLVDAKKSRGLGAEVKPFKGVKYLTISRQGIETRC